MRLATAADHALFEHLFVERRAQQVRDWGFDAGQAKAFLHSQFLAQRQSFARLPALREWVLTHEHHDCGQLVTCEDDGVLRLVELVVSKRFQRQGVAGRALDALLRDAERRALDVALHVDHGNGIVEAYLRRGFREVARNEVGCELVRDRPHMTTQTHT